MAYAYTTEFGHETIEQRERRELLELCDREPVNLSGSDLAIYLSEMVRNQVIDSDISDAVFNDYIGEATCGLEQQICEAFKADDRTEIGNLFVRGMLGELLPIAVRNRLSQLDDEEPKDPRSWQEIAADEAGIPLRGEI